MGPLSSKTAYHEFLAGCIHKPINALVKPNAAFVELKFSFGKLGEIFHYRVRRSWILEGKKVKESVRIWDGDDRTGKLTTLYSGYTNLKYWVEDNDANDVDVERVAPCTLFHYDRGHSSGQWFDATDVGRYYTRDALRGLDNRADSIYVAPGYKCTLWRDYAAGDSRTFHPGLHLHHDLRYAHLDDRASAVLVERLDASGEERGCYPATGKLMIFPGNSEDVSHRISVYANGDVYDGYEKHTKRRGWTSISNLAYAVKGRRALKLAAKWAHNGGTYARPEFSCAENVVSLGGTVKRSRPFLSKQHQVSTIAYLPAGCRPTGGSLDFTVRSGSSTGISHIMIHTDGKVEFHGVWGHNWLSLHGITFTFGA